MAINSLRPLLTKDGVAMTIIIIQAVALTEAIIVKATSTAAVTKEEIEVEALTTTMLHHLNLTTKMHQLIQQPIVKVGGHLLDSSTQ